MEPSAATEDGDEIEIEFGSELGQVLVVRNAGQWRCQVRLLGQDEDVGGSVEGDGNCGSAYDCFEYLSHLLKHDHVFIADAGDEIDEGAASKEALPGQARSGTAAAGSATEPEPAKQDPRRRKRGE